MSVALFGVQPSNLFRRVASANAWLVAASIAAWYCSTPAAEIDTVAAPTLASPPIDHESGSSVADRHRDLAVDRGASCGTRWRSAVGRLRPTARRRPERRRCRPRPAARRATSRPCLSGRTPCTRGARRPPEAAPAGQSCRRRPRSRRLPRRWRPAAGQSSPCSHRRYRAAPRPARRGGSAKTGETSRSHGAALRAPFWRSDPVATASFRALTKRTAAPGQVRAHVHPHNDRDRTERLTHSVSCRAATWTRATQGLGTRTARPNADP